jgi:3-(3-hydroxy-phenyl)propionate hydroxylase
MCHGLRDAVNLAWKLALVVAGKAVDRLLACFQPVGVGQVRHLIIAAVVGGRIMW